MSKWVKYVYVNNVLKYQPEIIDVEKLLSVIAQVSCLKQINEDITLDITRDDEIFYAKQYIITRKLSDRIVVHKYIRKEGGRGMLNKKQTLSEVNSLIECLSDDERLKVFEDFFFDWYRTGLSADSWGLSYRQLEDATETFVYELNNYYYYSYKDALDVIRNIAKDLPTESYDCYADGKKVVISIYQTSFLNGIVEPIYKAHDILARAVCEDNIISLRVSDDHGVYLLDENTNEVDNGLDIESFQESEDIKQFLISEMRKKIVSGTVRPEEIVRFLRQLLDSDIPEDLQSQAKKLYNTFLK